MEQELRLVVLPEELKALQQRWIASAGCRRDQDKLYAKEFAQPFATLFSQLPLHGAPPELPRPRALISILGFSWQPVALMAAWCKPEQMLVIGTNDSLGIKVCGEDVLSLIARVAGIPRDAIDRIRVGDPGETEIYRAVRDFLRKSGIDPRKVFVDPTGGKKSMSASAALAGFLAGTPLVYVDYADYHGPNRIPIPGTEYPRLLSNPLEVLGDLERRDIFTAFNRSDFQEAERLARRLAERLYEPREAEVLAELASAYGAWDRFDFESALKSLRDADELIRRYAGQANWSWAPAVRAVYEGNTQALDALKSTPRKPSNMGVGVPLLAWYLAAAQRVLSVNKHSLAVLLTYAAVERFVDLCLWTEYGLDDEDPDYSRVKQILDRQAYHKAGRQLCGKKYKERELSGPLMFTNGAQLLAALKPEYLPFVDLGYLQGLANARNKCEYEHGFLPQTPKAEDVQRYLTKAEQIIGRVANESKLNEWIRRCCFPNWRV